MKTQTKKFVCPKCKTHVQQAGKPGEKIILECPKCGMRGYYVFPENKIKNKKVVSKKQIFGYTLTAVILFCLLFFIIIPGMQGNIRFGTVTSESMRPNINIGDVIVYTPVDAEDVKEGDIVTFWYNSSQFPTTHRVVEIRYSESGGILGFVTRGDAFEEGDVDKRLLSPSELSGRVVFVIPYLGYIGNFARSFLGFILLIVLPGVLIIGFEIHRIYNVTKKGRVKKT
jgi:signal peptidase